MVNSTLTKTVRTLVLLAAAIQAGNASAFVLLSAAKATLPVTPANPTVSFVWDGNVPELDEKDKYREGAFAELDDKAFMQQLLQDALNIWNSVPGSYLRMSVTEGTTSLDEEDKVFSIVVEKSDNLSTAAFAKPNVLEDDRNTIADCDISIADTKTTAKDLAYTITHELGHCVGLGHPHTNYGAIMGYSRMSRLLKLGADDIAGVIYLYPDPNYVSGEPKEIVCAAVTGATGYQMGALLLLLLPLLMMVRQRPQMTRVKSRSGP
jgi:hypothetical protein